ncbi:MAG: ribonuclease [Bacteroidetes bacterium CG02_land_8_20_14_3_00_31_25]|nr:PhoH family protein [Bacteroidota bacterium]PIV63213.1 MAG: ribonuclease [Bacteroidetes bacterium CG02_land_8_20_14_3_00_31_25]PIX32554.1 MAG: ribonuclease [Bacteroidetes bacterium CG_4_8_14_3_um_filter_31_14]PIY02735.1 MAG: ribonuclease [Bacteroidetes bacterium CG_4_10_14_3_um_filter_31_20]
MAKEKKIFIVDTNVVLHDFRCIYKFQENDVIVPIVVLEELDKLKKGSDLISYNAREFSRELDKLSGKQMFKKGVSLGKNLGKLFVETGKEYSKKLAESFPEKTPDHRILAIADYICNNNSNRIVILITKDINLRMKAKSLGIEAQDYESDKVQNLDQVNDVIPTIEGFDTALISKLYEEPMGVDVNEFKFKTQPVAHQYFILKNTKLSVLAHYDPFTKMVNRVEKTRAYSIEPRNAEQTFALDALFRPTVQLVALTGRAGTGKTLLALAAALHSRKQYAQILLARPIVPLANRDLGYLPGDVNDKIGPYMQPLFDNLGVIKHKFKPESAEYKKIDEYLKDDTLVITPLAFIRGRSLSNVFFIIDEAQNLTPHEVKTIITRAGEGTKMIFTGDVEQIDSPYLDSKSNGLTYLTDKMKGQELFAHVNLIRGERSYLAELASNIL